ncbi:MAG TPA: hypothetical protein VK902_16430 [Rubrobacter sp.]|nr:hypothetical protein [Rubrobacter sp.]
MADARLPRYMFSLQGEKRCTTGCNMPMVYSRSHAEKGVAVDVTLAVLADYANVFQDGKLNIMGIFQEINPPFLPFPMPQMFLVVSFEAGPAEFDSIKNIRVALLDIDGNEMLALEGQVQVPRPQRPGSRAFINQVIGLNGVRFDRAGSHEFSILIGGETRGTASVHINEPSAGGG